jgi:glutamate dehydrogenase/leucine dehydrogenase
VNRDSLANAGGVDVSYFEWRQSLQAYYGDLDTVNRRLAQTMAERFAAVWRYSEQHGEALRSGAFMLGVSRVASALRARRVAGSAHRRQNWSKAPGSGAPVARCRGAPLEGRP